MQSGIKILQAVLLGAVMFVAASFDFHIDRPSSRHTASPASATHFDTGWHIAFRQAVAASDTITGSGNANVIRFLYMLINGPGPNGYPSGFDGPEDGLLGIIRMITGPDALGGGLKSSGYSTCSDIPASGEASMTDSNGTYRMVFGTPIKTIPSGYTNGGQSYAKRVTVQFNGTTFMNIEFNCDTNVGWVRMDVPGASPARSMEAYWDTEDSSAAKLEMYMHYEQGTTTGNEYFVAKFATEANDKYKFFITRAVEKASGDEGFRVAAYGDYAAGVVNAYMLATNSITDTTTGHTDNGSISTGGDVECLDVSDPSNITTSTSCGSLTLDSSAGTPIIDTGDNFSINWVADTTNGMKADMTALVDP